MVSTRQMTGITTGPNGGDIATSVNGSVDELLTNAAPLSSRPLRGVGGSGGHHNHHQQQQQQHNVTATTSNIISTVAKLMPAGASTTDAKVAPIQLMDLPVELLLKVLSYVDFQNVAHLRCVSQQFNQICCGILNSTFLRLQDHMMTRFQSVKAKMPRRESARRNHPLECECDIIETCHMRLNLLQMTFGKHIERKNCCFFPGSILDEVYNVLRYIRTTTKVTRPFKVTDELFDLSTMAMEYFKDHIEPNLPVFAYYKYTAANKQLYMASTSTPRESSSSSASPSPPQSNMVLRKGIRKIKQGMKRYNNQLSVLRNELRSCKRKAGEQSKQINEQQKLLEETQKQTVEYANRLDENDKKNEEMSRKFSTLLQELNKCKTELQYWRSKSPATPVCNSCGQSILSPPEEIQALVNQGVLLADFITHNAVGGNCTMEVSGVVVEEEIDDDDDTSKPAVATPVVLVDIITSSSETVNKPEAQHVVTATGVANCLRPMTSSSNSSSSSGGVGCVGGGGTSSVVLGGSPKVGSKRKLEPEPLIASCSTAAGGDTATDGGCLFGLASTSDAAMLQGGAAVVGGDVGGSGFAGVEPKKGRRVQNKTLKLQNVGVSNSKTRSK